ncbi:MAG: Fatty acid-binding protein [Firmicutes bacterium ADurb.Bin193]|nr:MAG: Fatty acid-binding protein [Firmicutes bacterium ADurb.Bin193]
MALRILTDSGADLPQEIIKEYEFEIAPMNVYLDDVEYTDGLDITPKEVYDRMRGGARARTSQIMPETFMQSFERYAQDGDSVIYIAFSSVLSGTLNSANIAMNDIKEKYPDFDITVIDTKCASAGHGLVVYKALVMLKNGASKEEIIEAALFNSAHTEHIFTVDNLEYLYRGGRLSRTSAFVGGLLGIKPVLEVNDEGKLVPIAKVKRRQNAIRKMAELCIERGANLDKQLIAISHGDDIEAVNTLMGYLKDMAGAQNFMISYVGSTIGAHSGPGTLAVFFLDSESPYEKYLGLA